MDKHVIEALGRAKITVQDGKIRNNILPQVYLHDHLPILENNQKDDEVSFSQTHYIDKFLFQIFLVIYSY
nr:hypothetical protein [uncultured Methanobrevibacter sp.]